MWAYLYNLDVIRRHVILACYLVKARACAGLDIKILFIRS